MKKVLGSLLVICLILSMSVVFADLIVPEARYKEPSDADLRTSPIISKLEIHNDGQNNVWLEVTVKTPDNVRNAINYFENHEKGYNQAGYIGNIVLQYAIDGAEDWAESSLNHSPNYDQDDDSWNGIFETYYLDELHVDSQVKARAYYSGATETGIERISDPSNELILNEKVDFKASEWARNELNEAKDLDLIPEILKVADLTQSITRAEFAAVSVKAYEALTGEMAFPGTDPNPFKDTEDEKVLTAYKLGITKGTSDTEFSPNALITREQMATMMTRVLNIVGTDTTISGAKEKFNDHESISSYAIDPVYYMSSKEIIKGVGENTFNPKGNATREQAIIIAVRMVKDAK